MTKETINVKVELELDRKEYETFRETFDETTFKEFCSDFVNEMIKQANPEGAEYDPHVRLDWLEIQNKRLMKARA